MGKGRDFFELDPGSRPSLVLFPFLFPVHFHSFAPIGLRPPITFSFHFLHFILF
jgi:hypothetical protein